MCSHSSGSKSGSTSNTSLARYAGDNIEFHARKIFDKFSDLSILKFVDTFFLSFWKELIHSFKEL